MLRFKVDASASICGKKEKRPPKKGEREKSSMKNNGLQATPGFKREKRENTGLIQRRNTGEADQEGM